MYKMILKLKKLTNIVLKNNTKNVKKGQKMKIRREVLLQYLEHYGIIMHTSYPPTGQRSHLKEVIQMQISSDINHRRGRDNQFFLEGKYDLGQGPGNIEKLTNIVLKNNTKNVKKGQKMKIRREVLLQYLEHYGIIMHTSYPPTGQRSHLKEVIQMQISSDINHRRGRDNQFFLEGKYDLGQGPGNIEK